MPTFRNKLNEALTSIAAPAQATNIERGAETPGNDQRTVDTGPTRLGPHTLGRFLLLPLNPYHDHLGGFGGTPDYIAPETLNSGGRFDDDLVSNFYHVLTRTNQQLANLWRPVVARFRRYEIACMRLIDRNSMYQESTLAKRIDTVSLNDIVSGARAIRDFLARAKDQPGIQEIVTLFADFYKKLSEVAPTMRRYLGGGKSPYFAGAGLGGQKRLGNSNQTIGNDEVDLEKMPLSTDNIPPTT